MTLHDLTTTLRSWTNGETRFKMEEADADVKRSKPVRARNKCPPPRSRAGGRKSRSTDIGGSELLAEM
ncbi:unnamed protein product [Pleuronectes platessa]|uniref:Uncharacterized protein n=1 Tax=Pleuronectes platessa TaxID=8262 RepID=A0A9N7V9U5_PLEPL|nr:unnamed protein product [Pleuronectes platessa]